MGEENLDVNPESSTGNDVMDDSSSSQTTSEQDVKAPSTMLDAVRQAVSQETTPEAPANEPGKEETSPSEKPDAEKEVEKEPEETEESPGEEEGDEQQAQEPVPYERFNEVNEKYKRLEQQSNDNEPSVKAHTAIVQYCNQNNITQEQFSQALEVQALLNSNPTEALKRLLPIVESLQGFVGDRLPKDLQERVDAGNIELADAKELAQLRAQVQFGKGSIEQIQRNQQERHQAEQQRAMTTAVDGWTQSKFKNDPDFRVKSKADMPDGKYEMVYAKFAALLHQTDRSGKFVNPVVTPQEMTSLLERAYTEVNKSFSSFTRKPATRRPLMHNGSSRTTSTKNIEDAKTMGDAIRMAVNGA